ncbi:MAG: DUF4296 domain-containing protein [Paludibacteraceae bacterium]
MTKSKAHIILSLIFLLFFSSCFKPRGVLNKEKMTEIIVTIHQTEGALQAEGFQTNTPENKKKYMEAVLKKHNISQADFDSSLVWYTKHPKEFGLIYEDVLARIDTLNAKVERGAFHPESNVANNQEYDIWTLKRKYSFTKDSARNRLDFEILGNGDNLTPGDRYVLSFLRRVSPVDSSYNPHIVLRINYEGGKKDSIYTKTHNDSLLCRYTLTFTARDTLKIESVNGSLLGADSAKGEMNGELDSIKLIRKFNLYKQSKLKNILNKREDKTKKEEKVSL